MDDYLISYTPSMRALANAQRKTAQGSGALVAGVSAYKGMNDLPNTRAEAEGIAALFGVAPRIDGAASDEVVKGAVKGKAYIHLACHGGFDWAGDAFASALFLANDEPLPLPQIMAQLDLDAARLVVLSACETGLVDFDKVPDEFLGLPAGFMQAGASAVISSLWTVEDRSTALLMEHMYKLMLDKEHPMESAEALRGAQLWLRNATAKEIGAYYQAYLVPGMSQSEAGSAFIELMMRAKPDDKPYAHPFYWAAFTYTGSRSDNLEPTGQIGGGPSRVAFTLFNPSRVRRQARYSLVVYAHKQKEQGAVQTDVRKFSDELGEAPKERHSAESLSLSPKTEITIMPEAEEITFDPPELTKMWADKWLRFNFDFEVPEHFSDEEVLLRISVQVKGFEVASIKSSCEVVAETVSVAAPTLPDDPLVDPPGESGTRKADTRLYRNVFLSYSHKDEEVAWRRARQIEVTLGSRLHGCQRPARRGRLGNAPVRVD
ncbi:MAG: CHAT domain-containing protein [Chloroflexi bacterium]|nr:CHAT domain-containing protein [Chloroflexota bacterium]